MVGLPDEYYKQSPFDLSGGQKRRVAIAGVLAMNPETLYLMNPQTGLTQRKDGDTRSPQEAFMKKRYHIVVLECRQHGRCCHYVERIIVMDHGQVQFDDEPRKVFASYKELEKMGLAAPQVTYIMNDLKEKGFDVDGNITTIEEATDETMRVLS